MSEFDDPFLRDRLSRYAGTAPGDDAALAGVQRRVRHVKRRRVAIWSGAAAVVIGVGAAGALSGPDGTKVTVTPADETALSTSSSASSTSSSSSTSTSIEDTTTIASTTPVTEVTTGSTVDDGGNSGSGSGSGSGGPGPSGGTNATSPTAATQPIPPAPQDGSRAAIGGVLHVRLANGSLSIVSAVPNPGFAMDVKDSGGGRVRVEFESSDHKSRVTATIVNGTIVFTVEEDAESRTGMTSSTVDGGGGGGSDGPTTTDDRDGSGDDGGFGGSGSGSGGGGGGGGSVDD